MSRICGARSTSFLPASTAVGMRRAPEINSERSRSQLRFLPAGPEITSYVAAIIASSDSTSARFAEFDIGRWAPARDLSELSVGRFLNRLENFHRRVMSWNPAHGATA